jgi:uroporphyrinogen decarboxylase
LLDRMEKLDVEAAMFPDNWDAECRRIYERRGIRPLLPRALRGPVTLATSIYGAEKFVYLVLDDPGLAARFRDVMLKVLLEYFTICRRRSDPAQVRPGFSILDDNCALMTPEMYALFGQPIVQAIYDRFAPAAGDGRYQHSDSDMGHLLPLLAATGMNRVNFGPNVRFASIRKAMPKAVVFGTLAPFTFMRNDEAAIEREVRRDLEEARATRGLVVATAGSVNNGTRLTSLRKVMQTIVQYGRFDAP